MSSRLAVDLPICVCDFTEPRLPYWSHGVNHVIAVCCEDSRKCVTQDKSVLAELAHMELAGLKRG